MRFELIRTTFKKQSNCYKFGYGNDLFANCSEIFITLEISDCLLQSFSLCSHVFCVHCKVCDYADRTVVIGLLYFCLMVRKVGDCFNLKMMICLTVIGLFESRACLDRYLLKSNTLQPSRM